MKLQRYSLDTSNVHNKLVNLERENALLRSELNVLRANPPPEASPKSHPAVLQTQQLTLSLRQLSDKLSLTENAHLERTTQLAHAQSEAAKAKLGEEGAYVLAVRARGLEEEGKARQRELEHKVRKSEEAVKMSDLVVNEYADLVRSLEGRSLKSPLPPVTPSLGGDDGLAVPHEPWSFSGGSSNSLSEAKSGLSKLFTEFSAETERLQSEIANLQERLDISEAKLTAEKKGSELDRIALAKAQVELAELKINDNTAAKMVSRYMCESPI